MITVDLGWCVARIKHASGKVTSVEIFAPPDASEAGVIQAQYIYLNAAATEALLKAVREVE